jgi:hypothetical protein
VCDGVVALDSTEGILPLSAAAVVAYEQVFCLRPRPPSMDELDLIAFVLSAKLPIYGLRAAAQEASQISNEELMRGAFWGGASRFELGHNVEAVTRLGVRKSDFERVLDELKHKAFKL